MAKKKQKQTHQETSAAAAAPSSSSAPATSAAPAPATAVATTDAEAKLIERAFDLGNFSLARSLVTTSASADAKAVAGRLLPRMNIEREQVYVGLFGLLVVLTACVLTLTRG